MGMDKYGVLWYWEGYINALLESRNLVFDKLICIRKTTFIYSGYFTLKNSDCYGQIIVRFNRHSFTTSYPIIWNKKELGFLKYIHPNDLIIDKRHEFDWIFTRPLGSKN
jgi:hypothetical protein